MKHLSCLGVVLAMLLSIVPINPALAQGAVEPFGYLDGYSHFQNYGKRALSPAGERGSPQRHRDRATAVQYVHGLVSGVGVFSNG
jgi:hypothetical protein